MKQTLTYFSLLGISEDASQEELEARYRELADYLASPDLPAGLREWARRQAALVDEAYAVLADPEQRAAVRKPQERAQAPVAAAAPPAEERATPVRPSKGQAVEEPTPPAGRFARLLPRLRAQPVIIGAAIGLIALGALVFFGTDLLRGGDAEEAPPAAQAGDLIPLDEERVAELTAAAAKDPNSIEVLFELGESYFLAGEWQAAIDWFTKLVAIEPDNVHALTDIGTSNYNLGFTEEAKTIWLSAVEVDFNDPQLHYNLGFLYANAEPQDLPAAMSEWQTVLQLAPDSSLAQTVQVHLEGLSEATPEASPAP